MASHDSDLCEVQFELNSNEIDMPTSRTRWESLVWGYRQPGVLVHDNIIYH